jgi:chorismate mutase / prephenate dehydratase
MSPMPPDLEDLRARLDEIDDSLQDLLIDRFEIVLQVAAEKGRGQVAPHQPAREAEIIRRLIARNRGALPDETLVRIWREILCGTTRLQGNFRVAVYAPSDTPELWDLARDHYGSHAAMQAHQSVGAVIRAVAEGRAEIGVLPMPQEEELDPWWLHLRAPGQQPPRVVSRLPFAGRSSSARSGHADALAVGRFAPRATGRDRTLFIAEIGPDISRARIFSLLSSVGLEGTFLGLCDRTGGCDVLIELRGMVPLNDPRIERFREQFGGELYRLTELGSYAEPLHLDAPAARPPVEPIAARG